MALPFVPLGGFQSIFKALQLIKHLLYIASTKEYLDTVAVRKFWNVILPVQVLIFLACDLRGTNAYMQMADVLVLIAVVTVTSTLSPLTLKLDFSVAAIFLGYYFFCIGDLLQSGPARASAISCSTALHRPGESVSSGNLLESFLILYFTGKICWINLVLAFIGMHAFPTSLLQFGTCILCPWGRVVLEDQLWTMLLCCFVATPVLVLWIQCGCATDCAYRLSQEQLLINCSYGSLSIDSYSGQVRLASQSLADFFQTDDIQNLGFKELLHDDTSCSLHDLQASFKQRSSIFVTFASAHACVDCRLVPYMQTPEILLVAVMLQGEVRLLQKGTPHLVKQREASFPGEQVDVRIRSQCIGIDDESCHEICSASRSRTSEKSFDSALFTIAHDCMTVQHMNDLFAQELPRQIVADASQIWTQVTSQNSYDSRRRVARSLVNAYQQSILSELQQRMSHLCASSQLEMRVIAHRENAEEDVYLDQAVAEVQSRALDDIVSAHRVFMRAPAFSGRAGSLRALNLACAFLGGPPVFFPSHHILRQLSCAMTMTALRVEFEGVGASLY